MMETNLDSKVRFMVLSRAAFILWVLSLFAAGIFAVRCEWMECGLSVLCLFLSMYAMYASMVLTDMIELHKSVREACEETDNSGSMALDEYQIQALTTCMPSCNNFSYMFLNLVGEVGELASKVAKGIRKEEKCIHYNELEVIDGAGGKKEFREAVLGEAGDILWQLSGVCHVLGFTLEEVARYNLAKLASRKQRGVIEGNGDFR